MTLVLEAVSKEVGAETHIRDVSLTLERGSLNVLLGATLAGKTSLMRLMAGLDAPTRGPRAGRRQGRHRLAGAAPLASPWSTSSSSTTPRSASTRTSPRPCASRGLPRRRSTRAVRDAARAPEARALSRPQAAQPLRRPAAAHRHRPRPRQAAPISCCSTSRSPTSTTSCARSCARNCRASSRPRARSSSTPRRSRRRRCSSAATPRPSAKGA